MYLFAVFLMVISYCAPNSAFEIQPRIVNGYPASVGQFPYFGHLEMVNEKTNNQFCGSALISDSWILTAAHCLKNVTKLTVNFGRTMRKLPAKSHVRIEVDKSNFFIHSGYNETNGSADDIALVRLPEKIKFTEDVRPVRLPTECKSTENIEVLAMGHGRTRLNSITSSNQLNFAFLTTLPLEICQTKFPSLKNRTSVICAQNKVKNQSVYKGDSGGPLVERSDSTLMGVSCFVAQGKCEEGYPQGFTSIYSYFGWIEELTGLTLPKCD